LNNSKSICLIDRKFSGKMRCHKAKIRLKFGQKVMVFHRNTAELC